MTVPSKAGGSGAVAGSRDGGSYDVVIVGGGASGCVLASRLSEDPSRSVLLLEAGPGFTDASDCPPELLDASAFPTTHLWTYEGRPVADDPHRLSVVRGRALGGSSSVNGMLYARGAPGDYDAWGVPLWTDEALRPFFERIENDLDHPKGGRDAGMLPLRRAPRETWSVTQNAFFEAVLEAGYPEVEDHLQNVEDGIGAIPRNSVDEIRMSAALAYLAKARNRPNLTVETNAMVGRVLIDRGAAVGVSAIQGGAAREFRAPEVVLAAGAIESPHLLILSGIGPRELLHRLDIAVVAAREGVGRNYSDHPNVQVIARLRPGVEDGDVRNLAALRLTTEGSDVAGDVYLLACSGNRSSELTNFGPVHAGPERDTGGANHFCLFPILHYVESSGEVEVLSDDPAVLPRVNFNYLSAPGEMRRLLDGTQLSLDLLDSPRLAGMITDVLSPLPPDRRSRAALEGWIASTLTTTLHGSGSCRMGSSDDPEAVVDAEGRVIGVEGLRIADLSVSPWVVRAPTNATAMVIAERVAQLIRAGVK